MLDMDEQQCPCGSGYLYVSCCRPVLERVRKAESAVQLMRSRYTAFVKGNISYLLESWHPSTRPAGLDEGKLVDWQRLEILDCQQGEAGDSKGSVTFRAIFKSGGAFHQLEESSRFVFSEGKWLYVDGIVRSNGERVQIGRNSICPCGSGKKYKKCCRP